MAKKVKQPVVKADQPKTSAKLSPQTRTAQQAKTKLGQVKESRRNAAMAQAVETMVTDNAPNSIIDTPVNNVLTLPARSAPEETGGNSKLVDVDVIGGMVLDPATKGNKTAGQLYKPEQVHFESVERLAKLPEPDFNAELQKLGTDLTTLQFRVALHMVVIAYKLQSTGESAMQTVHNFMDSLAMLGKGTSMIRTDAVKAWLLKYAAVSWGKPQGSEGANTLIFDKAKRSTFAGQFSNDRKDWMRVRLSKPFWILTPEPKFVEFSFAAKLAMLIKQADRYQAMLAKPDELKTVFGVDDKGNPKMPDLTGYDAIKRAMKKANIKETDAIKEDEVKKDVA